MENAKMALKIGAVDHEEDTGKHLQLAWVLSPLLAILLSSAPFRKGIHKSI